MGESPRRQSEMTTKIMKTTWRLLQDRFSLALKGDTPVRVEKNQFYYVCRKAFQDEWDLTEVDITGVAEGRVNPRKSWGQAVNAWAEKKCTRLGVPEGRFWDALYKLNIHPHHRGTCLLTTRSGSTREVVVKHDTKREIKANCSFIIVSEKRSKVQDIVDAIRSKGYVVNILSGRGHATGAVQAIVAEIADIIRTQEAENFYILHLHDYDLDGIIMLQTLRKWYPNVIDIGINKAFLQFNDIEKEEDLEKLFERVRIKKHPTELMDWAEEQTE